MGKHLVILLLGHILFHRCSAEKFFFYKEAGTVKAIVFMHDFSDQDKQKLIDYFLAASIHLPFILKVTLEKKIPFIFMCPKDYNGYTPVCDQAYFIEGARTALAWVNIFYHFKNLNCCIVLVPHKTEIISKHIQYFIKQSIKYLKQIKDSQKFAERIVSMQDLINISEGSTGFLEPMYAHQVHEDYKKKSIINIQHHHNVKSYLIVGGAGFIGFHLSEALLQRGFHVIVLDNLIVANSHNIKELKKYELFEFHNVDINDPLEIDGNIDAIIHLASIPSPVYYYKMPFDTLPCGLIGTKNLLDLAVKKNARFLFASSSEVYGNPSHKPQEEEYSGNVDPLGMRSQYDQSKRGGETFCKWYFEELNIDIRIARIFNTYGPKMNLHDGRVVTNFISSILQNKPIKVYGHGNQTRCFSFIDDTVKGLLILLLEDFSKLNTIQERIFNVGNDQEEYTINEIALQTNKIAKKYLNYEVIVSHIPQLDPTDPKMRKPVLDKIKRFGYYPQISFKEGFEKTFLHFFNLGKNKSPHQFLEYPEVLRKVNF